MDYQVLITDAALADLREIVEFVAEDDAQAAVRLGEKLISRALTLRALPERHAFHDAARGIRKMPLSPYLIFYTCDKEQGVVNILHFWHGHGSGRSSRRKRVIRGEGSTRSSMRRCPDRSGAAGASH